MWFSCKSCKAQKEHIESLKAQIEDLRRFAVPSDTSEPTVKELEADGILSGQQHIIEVSSSTSDAPEEETEFNRILSERDRLLSGQF